MPNTSSDLPGIHEVNTSLSTGKRSTPPTSKSAFLELYLRQNEKERLLKQAKRAKGQEDQIERKLVALSKTMAGLFKTAMAAMKGQEAADRTEDFPEKSTVKSGRKKKHIVLGY